MSRAVAKAAVNVTGHPAEWPGYPSDTATGGKWGYEDRTGKLVIAADFEYARAFSEGLAAVNVGSTVKDGVVGGGKWGFIDKTGHFAIPAQFGEVADFRNGLALVEQPGTGFLGLGGRTYYIDRTGNPVKPVR